jgi:hypothetical protein
VLGNPDNVGAGPSCSQSWVLGSQPAVADTPRHPSQTVRGTCTGTRANRKDSPTANDVAVGHPEELALGTLRSAPFSLAMFAPRHHWTVLEVQRHSDRFPFLVLEKAWRLAQRAGTDGVAVFRVHFQALADRCSRTLPPPERQDLGARFLGLLAMAHSRSFSRDEPLKRDRFVSEERPDEEGPPTDRPKERGTKMAITDPVAGRRLRRCGLLIAALRAPAGSARPRWRWATFTYNGSRSMAVPWLPEPPPVPEVGGPAGVAAGNQHHGRAASAVASFGPSQVGRAGWSASGAFGRTER